MNDSSESAKETRTDDREISLGPGLAAVPERLLLAHARGETLFLCGAGVSRSANLPDFRGLVVDVYSQLDTSVHDVISRLPRDICNKWEPNCAELNNVQIAEVKRFVLGDYDVVLGMLERRLDNQTRGDSRVRRAVADRLRVGEAKPTAIHRALVRLSDRGGVTTVVTTNFDLLLEAAARRIRSKVQTYSLGSIPRPSRSAEFSGVLHIHGALDANRRRFAEVVVSDQDFGEYYFRRGTIPEFIYDASRLFNIVLVGYSANDPPMRYLLNAVAADGTRFDDLRERFTFLGSSSTDPVAIEDWKARGITPIHYTSDGNHVALLRTLERWASLSAVNGKVEVVNRTIRGIVKQPRSQASEMNRDLFDHLVRRSNPRERIRLSRLVSQANASFDWLNAMIEIGGERKGGHAK